MLLLEKKRLALTPAETFDLKYDWANKWCPNITPLVLVIHYGVTSNINSLVAAQRASNYWAHVSIDGFTTQTHGAKYQIRQHLEFDKRGSHAGASKWNGRESINECSIGVEIANPGPLLEKHGKLWTVYGQEWPREEAVQARHHIKACTYDWWATYTDQEVDLVLDLAFICKHELGLIDVVGHDEIAIPTGRKIDPGPAMPMAWIRQKVYGREHILEQVA